PSFSSRVPGSPPVEPCSTDCVHQGRIAVEARKLLPLTATLRSRRVAHPHSPPSARRGRRSRRERAYGHTAGSAHNGPGAPGPPVYPTRRRVDGQSRTTGHVIAPVTGVTGANLVGSSLSAGRSRRSPITPGADA